MQDRSLGWVAQRIAEQRLLWNLRRRTSAEAAHPHDMTFDEVMTLVRRTLRARLRAPPAVAGDRRRRADRASGPIALVPGPNMLAYYFTFRVFGHWLSMRGASQGLHRITWSGRPCPPLTELRDLASLEPARARGAHPGHCGSAATPASADLLRARVAVQRHA